jgi:conjugal transfer pilus assembly protein TraK
MFAWVALAQVAGAQAVGLPVAPVSPAAPEVVETLSPQSTSLAPMTVPGLPVPGQAAPAPAPPPSAPAAPVAQAPAPSDAETMRAMLLTSPGVPRLSMDPPPPEVTVREGRTSTFGIAHSALNRLVTPFDDPVAKTASPEATVTKEGRIIYVATNGLEPISLFIYDRNAPDVAIALTLVPSQIPAVSVRLRIQGYTPPPVQVAAAPDQARRFESEQPYTEAIKILFRTMAQGKVPSGYGLEVLSGNPPGLPRCQIPGLSVRPAQLLTGHRMNAVVLAVQNRTGSTIHFNERACAGRNVLAVAAWPRVTLLPMQETEVYIAMRRPQPGDPAERPSALQEGW